MRLLRGFRGISVLAVLVTAYEIIAAAVLRSAATRWKARESSCMVFSVRKTVRICSVDNLYALFVDS